MYDYILLKNSKPVTITVKDQPLEQFLPQVLKGQSLNYIIRQKTIFVKKTAYLRLIIPGTDLAPEADPVRGRITDSSGAPLGGATVSIREC